MIYLILAILLLLFFLVLALKLLFNEKKEKKILKEKFDAFKDNMRKLKDHALVEKVIDNRKYELNEELKGATDEETKIIINNNLSILNEL